MAATLGFLGLTVIILVLTWIYQSYKRQKVFGKIPGPFALPILGNAHQLETEGTSIFEQIIRFLYISSASGDYAYLNELKNPRYCPFNSTHNDHHIEFYKQCLSYANDYGRESIFVIWLGYKPMICITNANSAETLLNSSKHMDKAIEYRFLHPWLGTGLLTSTGDKWRSRRKMLTPTFHFKILNDFVSVFNDQADFMLTKLKKKADGKVFNIFNHITLCALDIICETAMGRDVGAQTNSDSTYVKSVYKMSEFAQNRMKLPWYWNDTLYRIIGPGREHDQCLKVLHNFTEKVIREKREEISKRGTMNDNDFNDSAEEDRFVGAKKRRLAFLDMLIHMSEDGEKLSEEDIREEVDTFMFEGHDTTAAGINWATHLIGANSDVQTKLQDELDGIFGSSERYPTMEDLKDMKYLECCIKEALRLYPSVPIFGRTFSEDAVIDGHLIPKGTTGSIFTAAIHKDPKYFPDPDVFDPERFSDENKIGRHPFCYIPFSAGFRNCIGQKFAMLEEKVVLSTIFRNFDVESVQKREELNPTGELILRPESGILVKLTPRN